MDTQLCLIYECSITIRYDAQLGLHLVNCICGAVWPMACRWVIKSAKTSAFYHRYDYLILTLRGVNVKLWFYRLSLLHLFSVPSARQSVFFFCFVCVKPLGYFLSTFLKEGTSHVVTLPCR